MKKQRLFNGKDRRLCIDQYGNQFYAVTVKELCDKVGYRKASKMYVDTDDGQTLHVGYVIGPHWLSVYGLLSVPA